MDEMIWDIWVYEPWHMPPALPGDGLRMPGLDRAQAKKDSADANVATSPRTLCSLGKARWNKGFKFGPILPSVAIVQLAEAGTNCPWCGCTLAGSAITFSRKREVEAPWYGEQPTNCSDYRQGHRVKSTAQQLLTVVHYVRGHRLSQVSVVFQYVSVLFGQAAKWKKSQSPKWPANCHGSVAPPRSSTLNPWHVQYLLLN